MRNLIVPIGILAMLTSILIPLPAAVIDILLVANLILALSLLITALYISEPLKLSSLPTILLLATLYRLALNISTTRLILGSGNVGDVIQAFGNAVINGNLVVGAVVFLVITLVQFIVIAKGSERVAEVGARFTLDALPGKQMSIDADVRAGLIDFETAREKRQMLQVESQFYGALDGAMKFVKGDAIAGIIITAINVVGGLAVGVFTYGLDLSSAVSQYTLLTVGDGLVSQVPALLNALAAGLVATRVARGDGASLAGELITQLGQLKQTKIIVGIAGLLLAVAPGLPAIPFVIISILILGSAVLTNKTSEVQANKQTKFNPKPPALIEVSAGGEAAVKLLNSGCLAQTFKKLRETLFDEIGIIFPEPSFKLVDKDQTEVSLVLRGVDISQLDLNLTTKDLSQELFSKIYPLVAKRSVELLDDNLTRTMLDHYDSFYLELAANVVPGIVSITQLTEVLKGLVEENVPIKNFDLILQALAESGHKASSERVMLEDVRIALKRAIISRYIQDDQLNVTALDPGIDLLFSEAERNDRPINVEVVQLLSSEVQYCIENSTPLLTSKSARRLIRECLLLRGQACTVLAHEEIPNEVELKVVHSIYIDEIEDEEILEAAA
ncbi:MAG: flagellar biosynthesis protein FlhA [Bdellovibrionota bacterium]